MAACINPFSSGDKAADVGSGETQTRPGTGVLVVSLGNDGISARTILPETSLEETIEYYDITLTGHIIADDVERLNLDPLGDFPLTIPNLTTGIWTVTVTAHSSDGIVGAYTEEITILDMETTAVGAVVRGTQEGTGRLEYTLTWPAGEAQTGFVELFFESFTGIGSGYELTGNEIYPEDPYTADRYAIVHQGDTKRLELILDPVESGTYFLAVTLTLNGGENAPVIEAAQVYDNRTSSKAVTLEPGALTQPPAAPVDLTVDQPDIFTVRLQWTDASNTEEGFRIYRDGSAEPIAEVGPGIETWDDTGFTGGESYTYEVRSFNSFGESPAGFTVVGPVMPISDVGLEFPLDNQAAIPLQVMFEWDPGFGADTLELYILQNGTDVYTSIGIDNTQGGYTLAEADQLDRETTYTWYVVAENAAFRVQTPELTFTTRGPDLYVNSDGGIDNIRRGTTAAEPLATVGYAVSTVALPEDRINVAPGLYDDETIQIDKNIQIIGSGAGTGANDTIIGSTSTATTLAVVSGAEVTLTNLRVDNRLDEAVERTAVHLVSGSLLVDNAELSPGWTTADSAAALRASATEPNASLVVRGSRILTGESDGVWEGRGIQIAEGFQGTVMIGGTVATDGNVFASAGDTDGDGSLWQIYVELMEQGGDVTIRHNTFESLLSSGTAMQAAISVDYMGNQTQLSIQDNTIFGNRYTGSAAGVYGILLWSDGSLDIGRNTIVMGQDHSSPNWNSSPNYGIQIDGSGAGATVEANRLELIADDTQVNRGIMLYRNGTNVVNNVIAQIGNSADAGQFRAVDINAGDILLLQNTVVNTNDAGGSQLLTIANSTGVSLVNNILHGSNGNGQSALSNAGPYSVMYGNLFWNTVEDEQTLNSGYPTHIGNFRVDPELNNTVTVNSPDWFAPTVPSPSLVLAGGSADYIGAAGTDITGSQRTGAITVGAHQVDGASVIGAPGPAGGWVFYDNPDNVASGWRFLEAAHMDYGGGATRPWWTGNLEDVPDTLEVIGAGQPNTTAIVAARGNPDPPTDFTAGEAVSVFTANGYGDWFLPSLDELAYVYSNLHDNGIGDFGTGAYWSSTQADVDNARTILFGSGNPSTASKDIAYRLRPVRRF